MEGEIDESSLVRKGERQPCCGAHLTRLELE
jgi:hypothetical protein